MKKYAIIFHKPRTLLGYPLFQKQDNRLIQTCYECGAEREVKIELRPLPLDDVMTPIHGDNLAA